MLFRSPHVDPHDPLEAVASGWPRRRHYACFAAFFLAVAVYGSIIPLHFRATAFSEGVSRFAAAMAVPFQIRSRGDFAANVLLFVPIGYCLLAVLAVDRRSPLLRMLCVPLGFLLCALSSAAIEFCQLWVPQRVCQQTDVVAQGIGAIAGIGLWLSIGQTVTDWTRSSTSSRRASVRIDWLLHVYLLGLLIYSVMPLDLTLRPGELVHKYREGRIILLPFRHIEWDLAAVLHWMLDIGLFVPVGMWAAIWRTSSLQPVRPLVASFFCGSLVAVVLELAKLFVYSRYASADDVLFGAVGVWLGAWAMRRWRGNCVHQPPVAKDFSHARRVWLWLGLAGLYSLFLFAFYCNPFDPIHDPQQIRVRFEGFFSIPFVGKYQGPYFNALGDVLQKLLLFAVLGGLLALAVARLSVPRPIRRILLAPSLIAAAAVGTAIETVQVFLPPHVADVGDVVLYTTGTAIGMLIATRVVSLDAQNGRRPCEERERSSLRNR